MARRNRIQSERDVTAANRSVEAAALGTAAGTMILGAMLPHHSKAAGHHSSPSGNEVHRGSHDAVEGIGEQAAGQVAPDHAAGLPAQAMSAERGQSDVPAMAIPPGERTTLQNGASIDAGDWTHSWHGSEPIDQPSAHPSNPAAPSMGTTIEQAGPRLLSDSIDASSHPTQGLETFASGFSVLGDSIAGAVSSISHSITDTVATLSATLSGITHSLANPLGIGADNPVEAILHGIAVDLHDDLRFADIGVPVAEAGSAVSPALEMLASLPGNVLGVPDGGMTQSFGAPETLGGAHPSAGSFGDLSHPIQIGFVGQALSHLADGHDIGAHGHGSLLHGFV